MKSKCYIKNINLPPAPKTATKTVHNRKYYGEGRRTYELRNLIPTWDAAATRERASAARARRTGKAEKRHDKVMKLFDLGKTYDEIAQETGYAPNTVYKIVTKCRKKDQKCKEQ